MRTSRTLLAVICILALSAGAAFAADLHELGKGPKKDDDGVPSEAILGTLDCSGAIEVDLGVGVYYGTNVGAPNNVTTYGCTTWNESGGEVVYHVTFPDGVLWEVGLSDMACDLDLIVLDLCDEVAGCLQAFNVGVYVSEPLPGEFYFVVDGYNGAACDYTLTFTTTPYEPPSFCDAVQDVYGGSQFTGNTCDGENLISSLACGEYSEAGLEHYYEIFMPAGSSFTADVLNSADGALWLLDSCDGPFNCLAYADDTFTGQTESLMYTNATAEDISVFLVIDSYGTGSGSGSCGDYTFDFLPTGGAIATEEQNFGNVKAMFR